MIDLEKMILPLEGEDPAGGNLEYDPLYTGMDSLAAGVPDSQMGDSTLEGRGPDWKKLSQNCIELWGRTRDLRVASYLVVAQTVLEGLSGLDAGLKLLSSLVSSFWDSMYPKLDPDDNFDPIERLNILAMLSPQQDAYNDPVKFILRLRESRLVPSLAYTLRDYMIANNELDAGDKTVDGNLLRAEFMNVPREEIRVQADLASSARETLSQICAVMNEKMKDSLLSMESLSRELDRLSRFYATQLDTGAPAEDTVAAGEAAPGDGAPLRAAGGAVLQGQVNSRQDALTMLRKGAEYFQKMEPSSPVPLLVNRALRFADMDFIELLGEIVPDSLSRGRDILGVKPPENN
ncbi:MAG: type VI secretion system protein TssA [Treponema sp.]|nr:type VI secretion system protein TssA [Treponema sp.]